MAYNTREHPAATIDSEDPQKHNFWTSFDLSVSYFLRSQEIAFLQHSHGTNY